MSDEQQKAPKSGEQRASSDLWSNNSALRVHGDWNKKATFVKKQLQFPKINKTRRKTNAEEYTRTHSSLLAVRSGWHHQKHLLLVGWAAQPDSSQSHNSNQ